MKGGLANQLIGKRIQAKESFGNPADSSTTNWRLWAGMQPSLNGEYTAEVDAAWTEEGKVKVSAHDPWGNSQTFWLEHVQIRIT